MSCSDDQIDLDSRPFIATWGAYKSNQYSKIEITIRTRGEGYNYQIDWGDGSSDKNVKGEINHIYATEGLYTVSIKGEFPGFYGPNQHCQMRSIEQWGDIQWKSMRSAFHGCHLTSKAKDVPNLSQVTNMTSMFFGANLSIPNIGDWDVSNINNMGKMFAGASISNLDISKWDVSNVFNMGLMFSMATDFNENIGDWDVSNVVNMGSMFYGATAFNQDISRWNVSKVNYMNFMFGSDVVQPNTFDQNIGNWDVSQVIEMSRMFEDVTLSTANYDALLNGWSQQLVIQGVKFNGGLSIYSASSQSARDKLTETKDWKIIDGGVAQ
jgi:surface protein